MALLYETWCRVTHISIQIFEYFKHRTPYSNPIFRANPRPNHSHSLLLQKTNKCITIAQTETLTSCSVCRTIWLVSSVTPIAQCQLDHCYGACTGFQSGRGLISNLLNFVIRWPLSNSQATLLILSAHTVSLARCGHPHRSFCQFRRTTWTLLLVISLLLLQDSGTLFPWTVELLHLLTHLRPGLKHFSLFQHNLHCSTMACYKSIDWSLDWLRANLFFGLIESLQRDFHSLNTLEVQF